MERANLYMCKQCKPCELISRWPHLYSPSNDWLWSASSAVSHCWLALAIRAFSPDDNMLMKQIKGFSLAVCFVTARYLMTSGRLVAALFAVTPWQGVWWGKNEFALQAEMLWPWKDKSSCVSFGKAFFVGAGDKISKRLHSTTLTYKLFSNVVPQISTAGSQRKE